MTEKGKSIQPSKRRSLDKSNRGLLFYPAIFYYIFMFYTVSHTVYIQTQLSQLGRPWGLLSLPAWQTTGVFLNDAVFFKSIFNTVFIALLAMAPQMYIRPDSGLSAEPAPVQGREPVQDHFYFQTS